MQLFSVKFREVKLFLKHTRVHENVYNGHHCLEWMGTKTAKGYGQVRFFNPAQGRKTTMLAHRIAHFIFVGPIPDGMQYDHTCENEWCVNAMYHSQLVSNGENQYLKNHR
jgi:hypothetical protein